MIKTDAQLQRDVIDELRWDPAVGSAEIGVAAKNGVITLSGQIESFAKKYAAVRAAERVTGVRAIAEELNVVLAGSFRRTDTDLAHAVTSTLTLPSSVRRTGERVTVVRPASQMFRAASRRAEERRSAADRCATHR